jgi:hypothetical protein
MRGIYRFRAAALWSLVFGISVVAGALRSSHSGSATGAPGHVATFLSQGQSEFYGRARGPEGRVLNARPTLVWEVWSNRPGEIVGARAVLDRQSLRAQYDFDNRRVVAELDRPLAPGTYRAKLSAVLRDGGTLDESWTFTVLGEARELLPPSTSQHRTLQAVNRFRAEMGLPPFRMNDNLNMASLLHSRYLAANNTTGHYQKEGKPLFFGVEPGDRHEALGWTGDSWETVSYGSSTEEESVRNLIDAPYHRIPFIQPGEQSFGSGFHGERLTASFSMSKEKATVVHPYPGQANVPVLWDFNERPNPLRLHAGARRPVGYPIMLVHFDKTPMRLNVRAAYLLDASGREVPSFLNTPTNDKELVNALILMPKGPLAPNSDYTVQIEASVANGPDVSRRWSFRTAGSPSAHGRK